MSILDTKRAETISKILPPKLRDEIKQHQPEWGPTFIRLLPGIFTGNDRARIKVFLTVLNVYAQSEFFTLTKTEVEQILQLLYDFIISMRFLDISINAISIFVEMIDSIYLQLDLEFDWRQIYAIIYKYSISQSKGKKYPKPNDYISSIVTFVSSCKRYFKANATEEIIDEWKHMIDTQSPFITLATSLLCLFLPVNQHKQDLWFQYIIDLWSIFKPSIHDSIFLPLFVRLSSQNIPEFDWTPSISFFFAKLNHFLGVPTSPIDQGNDLTNFSVDNLNFAFVESFTVNDLLLFYAKLIVRLFATSAKETVKDHLVRLIHLLKPLHSPLPETDDGSVIVRASIFLNSLVAAYAQRVKADRRHKLQLAPLTKEDNHFFVDLILPLYILELYHAESSCEQLGQLVQILPDVAIPPVFDCFLRLSDYSHLKAPALRTIAAIAPTILVTGIKKEEFLNVVLNFVDDITVMDIERSQMIFTIYESILLTQKVDESMTSWVLTLIHKCIEYCQTSVYEDFKDSLNSMELMLTALSISIDQSLKEEVNQIIEENIQTVPTSNISRFCDTFSPENLLTTIKKDINEHNLTILKCIMRASKTIAWTHSQESKELIKEGLKSPLKKVRHQACACLKWFLRCYLLYYPFQPTRCGLSSLTETSIEWHVPNDNEFDECCQLIDEMIVIMKELFQSSHNKNDQFTSVKIALSLVKGFIGAVSATDLETTAEQVYSDFPDFFTASSPKLAERLQIITNWLLSIASDTLHEEISAIILKCFTVIIVTIDEISLSAESISERFDTICGMSKQSVLLPSFDAMFPNHHYWLALKILANLSCFLTIPMTILTEKVILKSFEYASSPYPAVRKNCESFLSQASLYYEIEMSSLFQALFSQFDDCFLLDIDQISTMCVFMSFFIQLANPVKQFKEITSIALNLCRELPVDVPNDNLRALRNQIVQVINYFDFNTPPLDTEEIYNYRVEIIYSSISRSLLFPKSSETQNYAVALICSVINGRKTILDPDVYDFLLSMFLSYDTSVRSVSLQLISSAIEHLIPRIAIDQKVEYDKLTPENFDSYQFHDLKFKRIKKKCSRLLSKDEIFDQNIIKQYFPGDYEERIQLHKAFYRVFYDNDSNFIKEFCKLCVDSQIHNKERFSIEKYSFWVSAIRFFGIDLILILISIATDYLNSEPQLACLYTASEIIAAVIFSTVYFKFEVIQTISGPLFDFIKKAFCGIESDTSFSWFTVLYGVLSGLDPLRFFWLFDFLNILHPDFDNQAQSKSIRQDSEICLLLIFSATRDLNKMKTVIMSRIPLYLNTEHLEIGRSAIIQVFLTISKECFRFPVDTNWSEIMNFVFNEFILKADNKFISRWLYEQFYQFIQSSLVVAPFCFDHLREFVLMDFGSDDDSLTMLTNGLICLLHSDLISISMSKEDIDQTINKIIEQLDPNDQSWPKQVLMLSLLIEFVRGIFYYISSESIDLLISKIVLPAFEHSNLDVQNLASILFAFIMKTFVNKRDLLPQFVESFSKMLLEGENQLAGANGLFAVIWSTLLFDDVPQYIIDAFSALTAKEWSNRALQEQINHFLGDFKAAHDDNFTENARELLSPFMQFIQPSYIS